jgi:hypothetical protein
MSESVVEMDLVYLAKTRSGITVTCIMVEPNLSNEGINQGGMHQLGALRTQGQRDS